ncbi:MAG: PAS domain-containing sensor histidine kinase [Proteobacteria bacterium]|nr:PAS domain-containing sensor histidine kinase [Pseudomonadota bacterium]MBU1641212.1 PAS domain-containing sensor histidine kinase [Pseudomonadota bacterium]
MGDWLKQDIRRLTYLIQYNPNTIILTDPAGAIEYVNAVFTSHTGYRSEEVIGRPVEALSASTHAYTWQDIVNGYVWEGELVSIKKDGSQFPEQVFVLPITDAKDVVTSVAFIKRDISERKLAEHGLLELTDTLELRVAERTSALDASNRELKDTLERLQRMQDHLVQTEKMASLGGLIAGVAHEINTPVGIAYTASTHFRKNARDIAERFASGTMTRSDLEEFLDVCMESSQLLISNLDRASELIRSFKQVAIDQSGEGMRRFYLREYIAEILLSLRPVLKKTSLEVAVAGDKDLVLHSFPGAFSQIITNLITNALIHAYDEGKEGRLEISFRKDYGTLFLIFRDDGKGIAQENIDHIFSPFFTTNREKGGSGLGLHIVYNIVSQRLHGTISCESKLGQGTTFSVTLPLTPEGENIDES